MQNFFFAEKNGVHRGKISVVDMVFLVFIGFLYPPPAWKVFLSGQKSSPKDFLSVVVVYAFFFSAASFSHKAFSPKLSFLQFFKIQQSDVLNPLTLQFCEWLTDTFVADQPFLCLIVFALSFRTRHRSV